MFIRSEVRVIDCLEVYIILLEIVWGHIGYIRVVYICLDSPLRGFWTVLWVYTLKVLHSGMLWECPHGVSASWIWLPGWLGS